MAERLQKVLSRTGAGSRRQIENWIREGRITVNGHVASLGDSLSGHERVAIDGKPVRWRAATPVRVIAYHKPVGELCTRADPQGRPTVFTRLPSVKDGRWIQIGRLDINTSGLLLLTTDGELANRCMHPSSELEREYAVRVMGTVDDSVLCKLKKGVMLEDGMAAFTRIEARGGAGVNQWFNVILTEGRKNEVRRLWASQGLQVSRLIRIRFGPIRLPRDLMPGHWQELSDSQIRKISISRHAKSSHNGH